VIDGTSLRYGPNADDIIMWKKHEGLEQTVAIRQRYDIKPRTYSWIELNLSLTMVKNHDTTNHKKVMSFLSQLTSVMFNMKAIVEIDGEKEGEEIKKGAEDEKKCKFIL